MRLVADILGGGIPNQAKAVNEINKAFTSSGRSDSMQSIADEVAGFIAVQFDGRGVNMYFQIPAYGLFLQDEEIASAPIWKHLQRILAAPDGAQWIEAYPMLRDEDGGLLYGNAHLSFHAVRGQVYRLKVGVQDTHGRPYQIFIDVKKDSLKDPAMPAWD